MTSYERILTTIDHKKPDRSPCDIKAVQKVVEDLVAYLAMGGTEQLYQHLGVDFRHFSSAINKAQLVPNRLRRQYENAGSLIASPYGVVSLKHANFPQAHRISGPFYQNRDLDSFDWPKPDDVVLSEETIRAIELCNQAGLCSSVSYDNPFKIGYFMRRYDDFMADCLLDPDYIIELLTRISAVEIKRAELAVQAGARSALISGDFADQRSLMVSPDVFRRVLKPILADAVARIKAINPDVLPILHSDGNLFDVLPDLIECGFVAVHPIQLECMDMLEVKQKYGDKLTLFGGISVQSELPFLKPPEIRRLVRQRIEQLGGDGGFMLAPTNTILPDVPQENTVALFREVTSLQP
jgi:uroporphyrinogen decarboxylase